MTTKIVTCPRRKAREKVTFVLAWFAYYQLFRTNEKKKEKRKNWRKIRVDTRSNSFISDRRLPNDGYPVPCAQISFRVEMETLSVRVSSEPFQLFWLFFPSWIVPSIDCPPCNIPNVIAIRSGEWINKNYNRCSFVKQLTNKLLPAISISRFVDRAREQKRERERDNIARPINSKSICAQLFSISGRSISGQREKEGERERERERLLNNITLAIFGSFRTIHRTSASVITFQLRRAAAAAAFCSSAFIDVWLLIEVFIDISLYEARRAENCANFVNALLFRPNWSRIRRLSSLSLFSSLFLVAIVYPFSFQKIHAKRPRIL